MNDSKHNTSQVANKGGRPRKGTLEYKQGTWKARLTVTVEGVSIRRWFSLDTQNQAVARRKLARLMAEQFAPTVEAVIEAAQRAETYRELAARVQKRREADGVKDAKGEQQREAMHIFPAFADREVASITSEEITELMISMRDKGKSQATIKHVQHILRSRFDRAWREGIVKANPVLLSSMPKGKTDKRERAVLTDSELATYLSWQHPHERYQIATLERQVMACLSRMFGGLRTGDLHSLTWNALDVVGGFQFGWAPRRRSSR